MESSFLACRPFYLYLSSFHFFITCTLVGPISMVFGKTAARGAATSRQVDWLVGRWAGWLAGLQAGWLAGRRYRMNQAQQVEGVRSAESTLCELYCCMKHAQGASPRERCQCVKQTGHAPGGTLCLWPLPAIAAAVPPSYREQSTPALPCMHAFSHGREPNCRRCVSAGAVGAAPNQCCCKAARSVGYVCMPLRG